MPNENINDPFYAVFNNGDEIGAGLMNIGNLSLEKSNVDVPGLALISLNWAGRYIGSPVDVTVTSQTYNILTGDKLLYELKNGDTVLYSFTAILPNGSTQSSHTIPSAVFANLPIGAYMVTVTLTRGGVHKEVKNIVYESVKPPTLHLTGINPNQVNLQIDTPVDILTSWYVDGRGVDSVSGMFELMDTGYSANIDITL